MKYSLILFVSTAIALNLFTFVIVPAIADPLINEDQADISLPANPCPTPEPIFQTSTEEETLIPTESTALETPVPTELPATETPTSTESPTLETPITTEIPTEETPTLPPEPPVTEPIESTEAVIPPSEAAVTEVAPTENSLSPITENAVPVAPCTPTSEPADTGTEAPIETPITPEPEIATPVPAGDELSDTIADVPGFVEEAPQVFLAGPVNVSFSVTGAPLSTLVFYRLGDATFSLSTGIGDDPVVMPKNFFAPGQYVIIDTLNPTGCASLSLAECRVAEGYMGESSFKI